MKVSDPIRGTSRGSMGQANAYALRYGAAHQSDVEALIRELYRLGALYGIDASILVSQSAHETAAWTSAYWKNQRNPAGLGAFDDGTYVGGVFPNGTIAAQAQFAHMLAYLGIDAPADLARTDPRYSAVRPAGFWGSVTKINDLGRGKWATDPNYAAKLAAKGNEVFPGISDHIPVQETPPMAETIVFGRVPKPDNIVDDFVDKPAGRGWANYGVRDRLLAIILHRVLGYARTTGGYFRNPNEPHGYNALTDWGICGSMDAAIFGAQWDGKIMDWNDPDGRGLYRSPYASGGDGTKSISGDAVAWAGTYGLAPAINRYGEAVELSGLSNDAPVSDKMLESIINLVAWRVDKKGRVPYNVWPKNNDGVHMLLSHYELGKVGCHVPDWVFERVITGVRSRLQTYQVVTASEPEPPPTPSPDPEAIYPKGMSRQLARALWNGPDGALKVSWSSKPFDFDETRSECLAWLERGAASIPDGGSYLDGEWPYLTTVIRRGGRTVHVYQFSDGWTLEKRVRAEAAPEQDAA